MKESSEGLQVAIWLLPRGAQEKIIGVQNQRLKIKVRAPAVENKANEALQLFLSKKLGVAKRQIQITKGLHAKQKTILIRGLSKKRFLEQMGLAEFS